MFTLAGCLDYDWFAFDTLSTSRGLMTIEVLPRELSWKERYQSAMLESDSAKLPSLLDDAINAVLDQIEETRTECELEELNSALGGLRSRRKEDNSSKRGWSETSARTKAA